VKNLFKNGMINQGFDAYFSALAPCSFTLFSFVKYKKN